jgi:hypothetical protein
MGVSDVYYDVPSTAETMGWFLIDIILFSLLAFYFDHVDQSNQGKSNGYFFFLQKKYWLGASEEDSKKLKKNLKLIDIDNINKEFENSSLSSANNINSNLVSNLNSEQKLLNEENRNSNENFNLIINDNNNKEIKGVIEEKIKILKSLNNENGNNENQLNGLKILGVGKIYNINNGFCRTKKLHALKEVKKL